MMVGVHEESPLQPRVKREGFDISPSPVMTSTSNTSNTSLGFSSFGQPSPAPQTPLHQTFSPDFSLPHDPSSPRGGLRNNHLGQQQSYSALGRQGMIESSSFFNQFTNPNGMDFANDILDMGMLGSPSLGDIDAIGNKDNKHGQQREKTGESKGLLEKYVGTFQQQQQQQNARSGGFRFADDQGPKLEAGFNIVNSEDDSPISAGAAIASAGAVGPGETETNSGDSLHQTHRQFLQHLQSMTAQQFHQAAMGSVPSGSNTMNQNGMMNSLGGNRSSSTGAGWGGYQTSSARFDDEDLLALMTGGNHDQSPDDQNMGRGETLPSGEFRQMMSDMHQHHLNSDTVDRTNKPFSVTQQAQSDRRGSYIPIGGAEYARQVEEELQQQHQHLHLQAGPMDGLPASAPAAFQDSFFGGLGSTASMGYGGYSYQSQGTQEASGMGSALRGLPVINPQSSQAVPHPIDSLSRRLTRGTPSLIDGSFSSVGDASLFSSIMGGKWGNNDAYRTAYQQDGNGQTGQAHDGISVMSQGDGSGASGRSPDSFMEDDRDGDIRMKDGVDSKIAVGRGRTKSTSKMGGVQGERQTKPKPKLTRRSSSIAAAASGGSAVRVEATIGSASGVGKAPRAASKTRPSHKRTGSNTSRVPNVSVPGPTSPPSSGPASGNGTVSPVTLDYALPSLDATFISPRPESIRERSESMAMTVDRVNIALPSLRGQINDPSSGQRSAAHMMSMGHQRRTGLARTPTSATLGMFPPVHLEEGLWRRHSMNDAVRPDLMSFASTGMSGDGMATVDEAVIEDGDAEDSPQLHSLSAEELAKARISRRRLSHNEVERKRRETINEKIQELETLLPPNVVAGAIAAREVESIKEEDEDQLDLKPTELINGKGKKVKPRNRKVIKKAQVPDKLCKGTVLCLTVDLVKQLQEMLHIKSAREQQLMMQVQALQSQLGVPSGMMDASMYGVNSMDNPFGGIADMGNEDLRSINELDIRGLNGNHTVQVGKQLQSPLSDGNDDSALTEQVLNDNLAALVDFRD